MYVHWRDKSCGVRKLRHQSCGRCHKFSIPAYYQASESSRVFIIYLFILVSDILVMQLIR